MLCSCAAKFDRVFVECVRGVTMDGCVTVCQYVVLVVLSGVCYL
jgi:hypothetical protein